MDILNLIVEYFSRLRKFWAQDLVALAWLLLAIPIMISFQSTVHEGTHSLVAFLKTGSISKIEPFLMIRNDNFHNGFTPAADGAKEDVTEKQLCSDKTASSRKRLAGWIGWPQMIAWLLILAFSAIFLTVRIHNAVFTLIWRSWYLAAIVDFTFNTFAVLNGDCKDGKDWSLAMIRSDFGRGTFRFLTFLMWLAVFGHFVLAYFSKWGTEPAEEREFTDYRWFSLVLAILGTISLLFYLFVRDDLIDYGSFAYVGGLLLQIAGTIFYWVYFWVLAKKDRTAVA